MILCSLEEGEERNRDSNLMQIPLGVWNGEERKGESREQEISLGVFWCATVRHVMLQCGIQ